MDGCHVYVGKFVAVGYQVAVGCRVTEGYLRWSNKKCGTKSNGL